MLNGFILETKLCLLNNKKNPKPLIWWRCISVGYLYFANNTPPKNKSSLILLLYSFWNSTYWYMAIKRKKKKMQQSSTEQKNLLGIKDKQTKHPTHSKRLKKAGFSLAIQRFSHFYVTSIPFKFITFRAELPSKNVTHILSSTNLQSSLETITSKIPQHLMVQIQPVKMQHPHFQFI